MHDADCTGCPRLSVERSVVAGFRLLLAIRETSLGTLTISHIENSGMNVVNLTKNPDTAGSLVPLLRFLELKSQIGGNGPPLIHRQLQPTCSNIWDKCSTLLASRAS